jgi:hypothetical protein
MTPSGIEPATFRLVAQYLNHCATAVPQIEMYSIDCNDDDNNDDDDDDNNKSVQHFTPYSDCLPLLLSKYKRRLQFLSSVVLLLNSYDNNFEQIH